MKRETKGGKHFQAFIIASSFWWKVDTLTIDAVMIYAQKGAGRRSNFYTDYTFGVRDGDQLVRFTKAYSGLTESGWRCVFRE